MTDVQRTSNLGVCPDCGGPFNGEFMHKPEKCIERLRTEVRRLDADAACEKAEKESLQLEIERLTRHIGLLESAHSLMHPTCDKCFAGPADETTGGHSHPESASAGGQRHPIDTSVESASCGRTLGKRQKRCPHGVSHLNVCTKCD